MEAVFVFEEPTLLEMDGVANTDDLVAQNCLCPMAPHRTSRAEALSPGRPDARSYLSRSPQPRRSALPAVLSRAELLIFPVPAAQKCLALSASRAKLLICQRREQATFAPPTRWHTSETKERNPQTKGTGRAKLLIKTYNKDSNLQFSQTLLK